MITIQPAKSVESPTSSSHLQFIHLVDEEGNSGFRVGHDLENTQTLTEEIRCFRDEFSDFFQIKDNRLIMDNVVSFDWTSYKVLGVWYHDPESGVLINAPGLIGATQESFDIQRKAIAETVESMPGPVKTLFTWPTNRFMPKFTSEEGENK
jgi:hypothetical protein